MTQRQIPNKELKRRIIQVSYELGLSHVGSNLTACDIIEEIYSVKKPLEKVVISNGHAHLAHLVVKEAEGEIDFVREKYIETLIEKYGIHCDRQAGCDFSTGSLGHGIGASVGFALADRSKDVFCLISDGECSEGSVHEALRIASEQRLENLHVYINFNGFGAFKQTMYEDIRLPFENLMVDIKMKDTRSNDYPEWLTSQEAHYVILDKKRYEELMEILK